MPNFIIFEIKEALIKSASGKKGKARRNRNACGIHENFEHRANNSAPSLPDSGLRTFGGVNFSSSLELRELPTFGAT
ncbi:MAG: hypothetical protein ABL858_10210 [Candidatus Nitrotoga sp.]